MAPTLWRSFPTMRNRLGMHSYFAVVDELMGALISSLGSVKGCCGFSIPLPTSDDLACLHAGRLHRISDWAAACLKKTLVHLAMTLWATRSAGYTKVEETRVAWLKRVRHLDLCGCGCRDGGTEGALR